MKKIRIFIAAFAPLLAHAQDDAGTIKVTTTLHDDGSKTVTTFNADEHTSSAETLNSANKILQRIVYVLDEQNQPASGTVYSAKGAIILKSIYKRDGLNRIIEEIDYTPDGNLLRRFTYEFGPNGKVSRIHAFDANGNELQQTAARPDPKQVPPRRHR